MLAGLSINWGLGHQRQGVIMFCSAALVGTLDLPCSYGRLQHAHKHAQHVRRGRQVVVGSRQHVWLVLATWTKHKSLAVKVLHTDTDHISSVSIGLLAWFTTLSSLCTSSVFRVKIYFVGGFSLFLALSGVPQGRGWHYIVHWCFMQAGLNFHGHCGACSPSKNTFFCHGIGASFVYVHSFLVPLIRWCISYVHIYTGRSIASV